MKLLTRRTLTMANLFEHLTDAYGERGGLMLEEPLGYHLFPSRILTHGDCVHFTNLAAEAFIRDLDLKKGERILLLLSNPVEMLLVAVSVIKAGGVVVPLDPHLRTQDVLQRAEGSGAGLVVADARTIAENSDLLESLRELRWMVTSGENGGIGSGLPRLDKAMESSSGFFLPYTLKPLNVVALFYSPHADWKTGAAAVTNEGLMGFRRAAALFLPTRCGDVDVCSLSLDSVSGFAAAVLGICAGLRLLLLREAEAGKAALRIKETGATVFMGTHGTYTALLEAGPAAFKPSPVRLWFVAGGGMRAQQADSFYRAACTKALLVESFDASGSATILALKPMLPGLRWPIGCPGIAVPPNSMRIMGREGEEVRPGMEGELMIKGPSVTPAYWDDLKYILPAKHGKWLRTGMPARKNRFTISLLTDPGSGLQST